MELRATLNIPANLTALGVPKDRLDELVAMALEDPTAGSNPVTLTKENTTALFEACF
jgi:alcohol dehydrogenase class IV